MGKKTQPKSSASGLPRTKVPLVRGKAQLNIGTLEVKDERLRKVAQILNSEKITCPKISLVDLAYSGEAPSGGLETSHIREFDTMAVVIGVFSSQGPVEDLKNIESELALADMLVVQNRIEKVKKERKARPQKEEDPELLLLERCEKALEEGLIKELRLSSAERKMLAGFQLLTFKPMLVVANISEEQLNKDAAQDLEKKAQEKNLKFISLCAKLEAEIEELPEEQRSEFLQGMGLKGLSRDGFIRLCLQAQELISFFTVVGKEARAWPIPRGITALGAAGVVHSDMERGFIRAEVINYKDFVECGSFARAKEKGLLRLESKEYPVRDGDIINFRFSV